jgi:hypothetical protein
VYEWTFGTFAKDFYAVAGWPTAFAIVGGIAVFFLVVFRLARRLNPFALCLLLLLYFQVMTQGMFYFRLGIKAGNWYILMIVGLAVVAQVMYPMREAEGTDPRPERVPAT